MLCKKSSLFTTLLYSLLCFITNYALFLAAFLLCTDFYECKNKSVYYYNVFIQKKEVCILLKWSNLFVQEIMKGTTNLYTIHKLPVFGYMNIVQCTYTYIIYECMLKTSHLNTGFLTLKFLFIFESLL